MRDVEHGRREHAAAHDHEAASTPGRTTNVPEHGGAARGGAPYPATMTGDRVPWSDRPEVGPRVDLTPKLSSAPAGPGLIAVQKLYATYAAGDGGHPDLIAEVARIVERCPDEQAAIRAFIEARDGADAGHALLAAVEESKRKKTGITFKDGAIDFGGNGLFPSVRPFPVPVGGVSHEKDSRLEAEAADFKKDEARRAQAKGDKGFNPIGDAAKRAISGPEQKSKEQLTNEQKITDALARERDGGTKLEVKKRLDEE